MKNYRHIVRDLFLCLYICMLAGCTQSYDTFETIQTGDPITPIRANQDSIRICLDDYVPALEQFFAKGESDLSLYLDSEKIPFARQFSLPYAEKENWSALCSPTIKERTLHIFSIEQKGKRIDIPVIPSGLKHMQAMYVADLENDCITIGIVGPINLPSIHFEVFWQNIRLVVDEVNHDAQTGLYMLKVHNTNAKKGRSYLRVYATGEECVYNDLLIPLQDMLPVKEVKYLNRYDRQGQVLYSILTDRFYNGNKQNDWRTNDPTVLPIADYMGGDIAGIRQKIEEGYFDSLGVNTLWISPITQNPYTAWGCYRFTPTGERDSLGMLYNNKYDKHLPYTKFSGYHGYWPIFTTVLDSRMGTETELHAMLEAAHKHGMNVILDYVANHLHIESPVFQEYPDWQTDSILPDGRRNFELWDEARLTTWFDTHIPTLDLEREEVCEAMTDSALHWIEHFDFDGFRHDACKHIPENYWRMLTRKLKTNYPKRSLWMIGETYGSPDLIGSYVKTGMLDAQFDFNVYFTAVQAIGTANGDMRTLNRVIEESLSAYGAHHTMGNISGNHDQVRFISLAGGAISSSEDGKEAGWTREIGVGDTLTAYRKALMLEVLNLTIPGVPCIYQGDEYGEPGGGDPDNRKMMRFDNLNTAERQMRDDVSCLIKMRRGNMALLYGDYLPVAITEKTLCFKRVYMNQEVLVLLNVSDRPYSIEVDGQCLEAQAYGFAIQESKN